MVNDAFMSHISKGYKQDETLSSTQCDSGGDGGSFFDAFGVAGSASSSEIRPWSSNSSASCTRLSLRSRPFGR